MTALGPAASASGPLHLLLSLQQLESVCGYVAGSHIWNTDISQTDTDVLGRDKWGVMYEWKLCERPVL